MSGLTFGTSLSNIAYMFCADSKLTTIYAAPGMDLSGAFSKASTFYLCSALIGVNGTTFSSSKASGIYACVDGLNGKEGYFSTW